MTVNISYIKLKGKVTDNYKLTKKGWLNKDVNLEDIHKVMGNSKIQFSPYQWRNGVKTYDNFNREKQDCIVLDIDDGMSIVEFQSMFKKYQYILATTKSHQKDKKGQVLDRFRVLLKAINIPSDDLVYFKTLELLAPFNDVQTLTKTASFLGTSDCIVLSNDGKSLDLHKASLMAEQHIANEKIEKISKKIDNDLMPSYGISMVDIKNELTFEIVVEILESVGYEVSNGKFKLREDENTASANISYRSLYVSDFGSSFNGDIFDILTKYRDMSFRDAIKYVSQFV